MKADEKDKERIIESKRIVLDEPAATYFRKLIAERGGDARDGRQISTNK